MVVGVLETTKFKKKRKENKVTSVRINALSAAYTQDHESMNTMGIRAVMFKMRRYKSLRR